MIIKKENDRKRIIKIGEAAKMLGTTPATLRFWERTGEILPARKTAGGTRYYDVESLQLLIRNTKPTDENVE